MSVLALAVGVDLGILAVLLWIIARAPEIPEDAPPEPAPEPQAALLDLPAKIPAPAYAVRALAEAREAEDPEPEEERPALADAAFQAAMRRVERERKGGAR